MQQKRENKFAFIFGMGLIGLWAMLSLCVMIMWVTSIVVQAQPQTYGGDQQVQTRLLERQVRALEKIAITLEKRCK